MNNIEELNKYSELFDIYKSLLTDKQRLIMDRYLNLDLSLNEIGEELNISRSGVLDAIEHAKTNLDNYEKKLKLAQKFKFLRTTLLVRGLKEEEIEKIVEDLYNGLWTT